MTRQFSVAHSKPRSHDCLAKAVSLELPLLRHWQHKICDPFNGRARHDAAKFSLASGSTANGP